MGEAILFNIAEKILLNLGSYALQQIGLAWGVTKEFNKLQNTISTIRNVLLDAEEQQVTNHAVKDWLQRLRDVVYDTDDLVDEYATEALRRQVEIDGSKKKEVRNFFTRSNPLKFRYGEGRKIRDIRERLNEIVADMKDFGFVVRSVDRRVETRRKEETYSFVRTSEVIGRDVDREAIIKMLIHPNYHGNVSIIPIVGMGGLGKTTLAQLVYNDYKVGLEFNQLRVWVCVSDDFDLTKIIGKIIKAATDRDCDNMGIEQLQSRLRETLDGKKFLLVLDDVWNEDRVKWVKLRDLLMVGANGSKVIVTTRSKTVASVMSTIPSYNLQGLPYDCCLSLFLKWAFNEGQDEEHQNLVNIGKEIVKKCGGVPLAARTLGGLLYSKTNDRDWLFVRDNEIWALEQMENDILPALRLSYDQMPSYLKKCFSYCSLFPKDEVIYKDRLVAFWMAEGFIQSSDKNDELEDIGAQYFDELVGRSFFQDVKQLEFIGISCKMHDLVHDLAQLVAGSECLTIKSSNHTSISERARHVSLDSRLSREFPKPLLKVEKLRTLLFPPIKNPTFESSVDTQISSFRYLRVLLLGLLELDQLPSSIGKLKHLRYLSLEMNFKLQTLPDSICKLLNLQTLDLHGCTALRALPGDFGKLIYLRYLIISSDMTSLPEKAVSGLTALRKLTIGSSYKLTSLPEGLQHLTRLRDLNIRFCQTLDSLPKGMQYLNALDKLHIEWCEKLYFSEDDLRGLRSLRMLSLIRLPMLLTLPKELQHSATTLTSIHIEDCKNLKTLSEGFINLTSLQSLEILNCPDLLFLPEGMHRLTALRVLKIDKCPRLSRRCAMEAGEDWPKISHVPEIYLDTIKIKPSQPTLLQVSTKLQGGT